MGRKGRGFKSPSCGGIGGASLEPLLWAGWLLAEWTLATMASDKHSAASRMVVSNETNKPKTQTPTQQKQKHNMGAIHPAQGASDELPLSPRKALLSAELLKHTVPVSFLSCRAAA